MFDKDHILKEFFVFKANIINKVKYIIFITCYIIKVGRQFATGNANLFRVGDQSSSLTYRTYNCSMLILLCFLNKKKTILKPALLSLLRILLVKNPQEVF